MKNNRKDFLLVTSCSHFQTVRGRPTLTTSERWKTVPSKPSNRLKWIKVPFYEEYSTFNYHGLESIYADHIRKCFNISLRVFCNIVGLIKQLFLRQKLSLQFNLNGVFPTCFNFYMPASDETKGYILSNAFLKTYQLQLL